MNSDDPKIRAEVAHRKDVSPEILDKLSSDTSILVKENVARNSKTSQSTLLAMSKTKSKKLDVALSMNENTPPEALDNIAKRVAKGDALFTGLNVIYPLFSHKNLSDESLAAVSKAQPWRVFFHGVKSQLNKEDKRLMESAVKHGNVAELKQIKEAVVSGKRTVPDSVMKLLDDRLNQ